MKLKLYELNGHWFLKRSDQAHRAHLVHDDQRGVLTLLAFLGLAEFDKDSWDPVLKEGEFEL